MQVTSEQERGCSTSYDTARLGWAGLGWETVLLIAQTYSFLGMTIRW